MTPRGHSFFWVNSEELRPSIFFVKETLDGHIYVNTPVILAAPFWNKKKVAFNQIPNCSWKKQRKSHFEARERTCYNVFYIMSSFLRESGCTNSYIMTIIVKSSDENEARQKMITLHFLDCSVEGKKVPISIIIYLQLRVANSSKSFECPIDIG